MVYSKLVARFNSRRRKGTIRVSTKFVSFLVVAALAGNACYSAPRENMKIIRQVILSPEHKVAPYSIAQASNGDLIIAGASNVGNYRAWAMRVSKSGEPIWEYLDGPADGWTDYSQKNQRFYGAVGLENGNTLLCGIKQEDKKNVAFVMQIGPDGKLRDEHILRPSNNGYPAGGLRCLASNDGVVVLVGLALVPRGTGWMLKFDAAGNFLWEKLGDQYFYLDAMLADNGGLFMIGGNEVTKIDREGNLLSRHSLPGSEQRFLRSIGPPKNVRIGTLLSTLETEIIDFDLNLQGPLHTTHLENIATKRGLDSGNGTGTLFGSRYFNGATAGAARVYPNGDSKMFTLEPRFQSGWFYDAIPVDPLSGEFATVRNLNDSGTGALAWIAFK